MATDASIKYYYLHQKWAPITPKVLIRIPMNIYRVDTFLYMRHSLKTALKKPQRCLVYNHLLPGREQVQATDRKRCPPLEGVGTLVIQAKDEGGG